MLFSAIASRTLPGRPTARKPDVGKFSLTAYEELAAELKYHPIQLVHQQLLRFMDEQGIDVYDFDPVNAYLTRIARSEGKEWLCRPLRQEDVMQGWNGRDKRGRETGIWSDHGHYNPASTECRPYNKLVPLRALQKVKLIRDKFGERVRFFVSDYAVPNPDPFIFAKIVDIELVPFDVWDEPGFGIS